MSSTFLFAVELRHSDITALAAPANSNVRRRKLRFGVGDRVECDALGGWCTGIVCALGDSMEGGLPYRVLLEGDRDAKPYVLADLAAVSRDDETAVRAAPRLPHGSAGLEGGPICGWIVPNLLPEAKADRYVRMLLAPTGPVSLKGEAIDLASSLRDQLHLPPSESVNSLTAIIGLGRLCGIDAGSVRSAMALREASLCRIHQILDRACGANWQQVPLARPHRIQIPCRSSHPSWIHPSSAVGHRRMPHGAQ